MKVMVFTGAGVSAESGIPTYRDADGGLWNDHPVEEVATAEAWATNPGRVLEFFNAMQAKLSSYKPNAAHRAIAALQRDLGRKNVYVITQNIDDLHERAGTENVIHLHGQLNRMRSEESEHGAIAHADYRNPIKLGDRDPATGMQFRPDVVLFGENVPNFASVSGIIHNFDALVVIGTSLQVYPAAGIVDYFVFDGKPIVYIDPNPGDVPLSVKVIRARATVGTKGLLRTVMEAITAHKQNS